VSGSGKVTTIEPKGLVFCTPEGRPLDPNGFQKKEFTNAVIAAQIGDVRFHDLRHTYGSWKIAQGEDILYVSAQMGHADAAITLKIYSHLLKKDRPEACSSVVPRFVPQKSSRTDSGVSPVPKSSSPFGRDWEFGAIEWTVAVPHFDLWARKIVWWGPPFFSRPRTCSTSTVKPA
jgi:Phage integrase family